MKPPSSRSPRKSERAALLGRVPWWRPASGLAGPVPDFLDAQPSQAPSALASRCTQVPWEKQALLRAVREGIDPALRRIKLNSDCLRAGINEIEMECHFANDIDLEAIYLIGSFGVRLEGAERILERQPDRLSLGSITGQGFPFYSGKIRYRINLEPLPGGARPDGLDLGQTLHAACGRVLQSDEEVAIIAFPPYSCSLPRWEQATGFDLELTFTRRNTFGPLHLVPREQWMIGPSSFRSEGAAYQAAPVLYPCGLLAAPTLTWPRPEGSLP